VWCLVKHRDSFTSHLPHSYQNLSPAGGLCIFVNVCKYHLTFCVSLHFTAPCTSHHFVVSVSLWKPLSIPFWTVPQQLIQLVCRSTNLERIKNCPCGVYVLPFLLSQSDMSLLHVQLSSCVLSFTGSFPCKFSCHMYILTYFRVCKSLYESVCFLGIDIMNLQVP
jgi:hypothetical protein